MQKYFFIPLCCFALLCFACGSKAPEGILSKEQMVDIMSDCYITEASVNMMRDIPADSLKKVTATYYSNIFEKHHTSSSQFSKSLDYYSKDFRDMEDIYDKILEKFY